MKAVLPVSIGMVAGFTKPPVERWEKTFGLEATKADAASGMRWKQLERNCEEQGYSEPSTAWLAGMSAEDIKTREAIFTTFLLKSLRHFYAPLPEKSIANLQPDLIASES
jgi:hypothetical protein